MDAIAASHAQLLSLNADLVARAVAGLSDEELARQPGEGSNPMWWILGHLAATRYMLASMLGGAIERPSWAAHFARGSVVEVGASYPPAADLIAAVAETGRVLQDTLGRMSDSDWAAPAPRNFPVADKSLRGALAFLVFHEGYHVGQLAYLRKWLGHSALVG